VTWTTADIPDLTGRTAVVTGANSGIGFGAVVELARHGAAVTLAARDPGRGADALARLRSEVPAADARLAPLDLADLGSVREFAARYAPDGLDLLVNNAGVMAVPLRRTPDGFESQFGTNHLGHFALTGLLLPKLLARPGARVVSVTSGVHRIGRIDFGDLDAQGRYRKWPAYAQSKLANLLFTFELQRRADAAGVELLAVAAHPGYAATNLQAVGPQLAGNRVVERGTAVVTRVIGQPARDGALPTLRAATDPAVRGGEVFGPDGFLELRGAPKQVAVSRRARDRAVAERLWTVSEEKTGVRYPALDPA
jgi:NAD(P)-dependent dehydrogenase (short-subunit alcohol dehydrogenase family)